MGGLPGVRAGLRAAELLRTGRSWTFTRSLRKEGCSHPWLPAKNCAWFAPSPHKEHLKTPVLQQSGSPAWRGTVGGPVGGSKP